MLILAADHLAEVRCLTTLTRMPGPIRTQQRRTSSSSLGCGDERCDAVERDYCAVTDGGLLYHGEYFEYVDNFEYVESWDESEDNHLSELLDKDKEDLVLLFDAGGYGSAIG